MTDERNKYEFKSTEEQKLYDVKAKLEIAKLVLSICLAKVYNINGNRKLILKGASQYFPEQILTELAANIAEAKPETYSSWNEQISMRNLDGLDNCKTDKFLRDIIVDYYLVKKSLPTKEDILHKIINTNTCWKISHAEICMKTRGYKSKRLPHCTKTIIVEDPVHSWERIKYLQSIEKFRIAGAHIIYIEEKIANENGYFFERLQRRNEDVTLFTVAVSPLMGMISNKVINIPKNSMPACEEDKYSLLTKWILETVVPKISIPSVFLLEDKVHDRNTYTDMPTMYSSRNEMINWLEFNDIPHNSNMHSAELFEIIKRSSRNVPKRNVLDESLLSHGHKVLRRPPKTQYLNYFNIHWEKVRRDVPNCSKMKLFNETSLCEWKELEIMLGDIEQKALREDIAIHNTIEKIFTFAQHERIPYDYIEQCDDNLDEFKMEEIIQILES